MKYKVLIADDEPIMRKAMQTLIDWEAMDCQLTCVASSGQEVMDHLQLDIPDIMILDIKMPGISGMDLCEYIYCHKLAAKVIILTAYADFSYAQQAVKYDVVDYVIKTGTFEELAVAIEKAKSAIEEDALHLSENHQEILMENFFKSVFDGSCYIEKEIQEKAERIGIALKKKWIVLVVRFRLGKDKEKEYIYQSLRRFFNMVFERDMVYGVPMHEDEISIVLAGDKEDFEKNIYVQCEKIVEMMDKFMELNVYIGISESGTAIHELKKRFDEAKYAVEEGYFYEFCKINHYKELHLQQKDFLDAADLYLKGLFHSLKKGNKKESFEQLDTMMECLMNHGCSTNTILDTGTEILSYCKKLLSEYDKALYELLPYERNLTHRIYQCKHISEYMEILKKVIEQTVAYINIAVSKKHVVIYEAEKYIEEHYEESITVSEIARSVNVSLSYLSRIYKETTGQTLIYVINQKKLEKAKEYLCYTDKKVYEIAEKLGFENITYFSYFFKKNTGMSPKEYKNQCKDSNF